MSLDTGDRDFELRLNRRRKLRRTEGQEYMTRAGQSRQKEKSVARATISALSLLSIFWKIINANFAILFCKDYNHTFIIIKVPLMRMPGD